MEHIDVKKPFKNTHSFFKKNNTHLLSFGIQSTPVSPQHQQQSTAENTFHEHCVKAYFKFP